MGTPISVPLVNGFRHSWASVEIKLAGVIFYITAVNYERTRSRTLVKVNHPDPISKTRGSNEYKADCEMLLAEFTAFQAALLIASLATGGLLGYGDIFFDVVVQYTENGLDTVTDTIKNCTLDSTKAANQEGTDPSKRTFDLGPLKILFNGADDLGLPLQSPPGL
jgi:hypothetical protein